MTSGLPPNFRLNAPQVEEGNDEAESSNPFGTIADVIEHPPSEKFGAKKPPPVVKKDPAAKLDANKSSDPYSEWKNDQDNQQLIQLQQQILQQQQQILNQNSSRVPVKLFLVLGVLIILLLIGVIITVAVTASGSDDDMAGSNPAAQLSPSLPPVLITPPPRPPTEAPATATTAPPASIIPTSEPKTTLAKVRQRGFLRCGVPIDKPGFATLNLDTLQYEGFDVDMVSFRGLFG